MHTKAISPHASCEHLQMHTIVDPLALKTSPLVIDFLTQPLYNTTTGRATLNCQRQSRSHRTLLRNTRDRLGLAQVQYYDVIVILTFQSKISSWFVDCELTCSMKQWSFPTT
jgi:hypothetical protein